MKIRALLISSVLALFLAACAVASKNGVSDNEIGLRSADLFNESSVVVSDINWSKEPAGMSQKIERSYENAPPLIPHDLEGLLPITKDNNMCVSCHMPAVAADMGATPIPTSHLYDIRRKQDLAGELDEARFVCTTCHVPQANTAPLVKNNFKPDFRQNDSKERSNLLDVLNDGVR